MYVQLLTQQHKVLIPNGLAKVVTSLAGAAHSKVCQTFLEGVLDLLCKVGTVRDFGAPFVELVRNHVNSGFVVVGQR